MWSPHGLIIPDDPESQERIRTAAQGLAMVNMRCWNLHTYTNEVFAQDPLRDGKQMGEMLGFRVRGYTGEQLREAGIPQEKAPWLWLAQCEDAVARPRFGFDDREQNMLRLALDGETDETIAHAMNASLTTTKKRFRAIYEKVQNADGGWEILSEPPVNGVRGVEIRRHLLRYLRDHPEELRPYRYGAVHV